MYADDPLVLELLALLKAHGVKDVVISPGSRHIAFTRSFEHDSDFQMHSIVDERSAAFFALGLIQAERRPVAIMCTSGTAAINYGSAIAEAYYQGLPLIALTADRLPELLHQTEDQMIDQRNLFGGLVRYAAQLRHIATDGDRWYCNRVLNEALIVAQDQTPGPVHINVPVRSHTSAQFTVPELPSPRVIRRHRPTIDSPIWEEVAARMTKRRVLIAWGQGYPIDQRTNEALGDFCSAFDAVLLADHLSNVHHPMRISSPLRLLKSATLAGTNLKADVLITLGGNFVFKQELKAFLVKNRSEHWRVGEDGLIADPYRILSDVFATDPATFFAQSAGARLKARHTSSPPRRPFSDAISAKYQSLPRPASDYGELSAISKLIADLPRESALHIANSAPIRMAMLSDVDPSSVVFCNRGVNGIDGCMSTALGYATKTDRQTFLVIGDLAFFYDMNALFARIVPSNLRILLVNNRGGAIMHSPLPDSYNDDAGQHVSAAHAKSAQGWVESMGVDYRSCSSDATLEANMAWLVAPASGRPRLLEAFTEKVSDIHQLKAYYRHVHASSDTRRGPQSVRKVVGRTLRQLRLR